MGAAALNQAHSKAEWCANGLYFAFRTQNWYMPFQTLAYAVRQAGWPWPKNLPWQKAKPAELPENRDRQASQASHSNYSGLPGTWAPPKMKPPQRVSQGGYQSLDSLRDDDCPQRKRADCECYGDQRCCRIDALPHNRGCDCCRVLLLTR